MIQLPLRAALVKWYRLEGFLSCDAVIYSDSNLEVIVKVSEGKRVHYGVRASIFESRSTQDEVTKPVSCYILCS